MNDHSITLRRPPPGEPRRKAARKAGAQSSRAAAPAAEPRPDALPQHAEAAQQPASGGASPRRQEQIEARRYQIGAAALDLFEIKGYHATTMADIARRAGISVGLIYQYAVDKEALLEMVLRDVLESYAREIPRALEGVTDPLLGLRTAITAYTRVVATREQAGILGYQEGKSLTKQHRREMMARELETNRLIAVWVERCIASNDFRPLNIELMTYRIIMVAHAWALKYWHLSRISNLDAYLEDNIEFLFSGALTPAGRQRYQQLGFKLDASSEGGPQ